MSLCYLTWKKSKRMTHSSSSVVTDSSSSAISKFDGDLTSDDLSIRLIGEEETVFLLFPPRHGGIYVEFDADAEIRCRRIVRDRAKPSANQPDSAAGDPRGVRRRRRQRV